MSNNVFTLNGRIGEELAPNFNNCKTAVAKTLLSCYTPFYPQYFSVLPSWFLPSCEDKWKLSQFGDGPSCNL